MSLLAESDRVRILDIVAEKAQMDRTLLVPELKLSALNISSLDIVEIVFALEEGLGIEMPFNANTATTQFQTLGDIMRAVEDALAQKG